MKDIKLTATLTKSQANTIDVVFEKATEFANECGTMFEFEFLDIKCQAYPGGDPKRGVENYSRFKMDNKLECIARN
jgi:hypothetical protein